MVFRELGPSLYEQGRVKPFLTLGQICRKSCRSFERVLGQVPTSVGLSCEVVSRHRSRRCEFVRGKLVDETDWSLGSDFGVGRRLEFVVMVNRSLMWNTGSD